MDSIRPAVRAHYERLNVKVVLNPEQESTDFTKCINYLRSNQEGILHAARLKGLSATMSKHDERNLDIVVMGGLGGRVDQGLSQIHHIYTYSQLRPDDDCRPLGDLFLVSEESISFMLREGRNTILTPGGSKLGLKLKKPDLQTNCPLLNGHSARQDAENNENSSYLAQHVGIIPIIGPAFISTSGLEWDVRDWKTEIGGQLSTSNHIRADVITIETSAPVLFTAELDERLKASREG
jgi:thiamine pyrophosphokinase